MNRIKPQKVYAPLYHNKDKFIFLVTGGRGCESPTTRIMMSDLSVKMIKDIKVGDKVMGDDGTPRNVLETLHGYSDMYRVKQKNAEDYIVNDGHILTIKKNNACKTPYGVCKDGSPRRPNGRYPQYADVTDIPVLEYKDKSEKFKNSFVGFKSGSIPYKEQSVNIEPYMLGLWLGDGTSIFPRITNPDKEVLTYLEDYCAINGQRLYKIWKQGAWHIGIVSNDRKKGSNIFLNNLRGYNLIGNKHIPQCYISNSENVRLELLAGLLDTDGTCDKQDYEITQKSHKLSMQIKFIADTLGFRTHISDKKVKGNVYYRINISGDIWRIPCKIERKKAHKIEWHKNWRVSRIDVEPIGIGEWNGIRIDGNQRYLHADGTVTHNCGKSFNVSTLIERLLFEVTHPSPATRIVHQVLYTRYTMMSANMSVIPEFMEKVELDGNSKWYSHTKTDVINLRSGGGIMFRGIKTSSGNQTAKLKSIHGITTFVVDEAEEWTSEKEFETIMLSIRQKGIQNRIIIIMNPTDNNHWVYKRFIEKTHKIVYYDGVPVQISTHPNVLHIHTTYLDNKENLSPEFLKEIDEMKEKDPEKYAHIVMGQWADVAEGAVFKKIGIVKEFPRWCKKVALGQDFGYTCFRGDTLITTQRGEIPIKDVKVGDYVLTRNGYHRVRKNIYNGVKKVIEKELVTDLHKSTFFATFEHNFNANGKWKNYGELTKRDTLCVLSNSMGTHTKDTQMGNMQTIISNLTDGVDAKRKDCTMRYGNTITSKRFLLVWIYIISIITHLTTILATLCSLLKANTKCYIQKNWLKLWQRGKILLGRIQKQIGMNVEKKQSNDCNLTRKHANGVAKSILRQTYIKGSAQSNATTDGNINLLQTMWRWSANIAEKLLWGTNTSSQSAVQKNTHIDCCGLTDVRTKGEQWCDVYDLEIEGVHEYFANGFLVHNCDPSATIRCGIVDNRLYLDEIDYRTALLAKDIIQKVRPYNLKVYADSADPRLIQEIHNGGIKIYPTVKGPGSIMAGIQKMQEYEIFVTEHSYNLRKEFRNYVWSKDKNGNPTNEPEDHDNHLIDAARYYTLSVLLGKKSKKKDVSKGFSH